MNTTTRKFPRTLAEAFPSSTEYACAIERTRRIDKSGYIIVAVCSAITIAPYLWFWLTRP